MNIILREANQIMLEDGTIIPFDNGKWPMEANGNPVRKSEADWDGKTVVKKSVAVLQAFKDKIEIEKMIEDEKRKLAVASLISAGKIISETIIK
jgi:hypothetical protein